jgi:hypothetical protein
MTRDAAAKGFAAAYQKTSMDEEGEYVTTYYRDANGVYSYSDPSFTPCQPIAGTSIMGCAGTADPENRPEYTIPVGTGHTHPLEDEANQSDIISDGDIQTANRMYQDYQGLVDAMYVSSVTGRVLRYDPSKYVQGKANQCQAMSVVQGPASPPPCMPY